MTSSGKLQKLLKRLNYPWVFVTENAKEEVAAKEAQHLALLESLRAWEAENPEFAAQMPWAKAREEWEASGADPLDDLRIYEDSFDEVRKPLRVALHDIIWHTDPDPRDPKPGRRRQAFMWGRVAAKKRRPPETPQG